MASPTPSSSCPSPSLTRRERRNRGRRSNAIQSPLPWPCTTATVLHHQRPCRRRPYPLALSPYPRRRAGREEPSPRSTLAPVRTGGAPAGSEQEHRVVHVPGVPRSIRPTLCSPCLPRCWGIQIEQVRCRRSTISMRYAGEATVMLVVDASAVFHRHTAAPSDAALPRDKRPWCRSAGTKPRARRCHGHGGLQGLYEPLELRGGGSDYLGKVWQHRRVDDEGGDRGGERRKLVAAGLDGTAHICASWALL